MMRTRICRSMTSTQTRRPPALLLHLQRPRLRPLLQSPLRAHLLPHPAARLRAVPRSRPRGGGTRVPRRRDRAVGRATGAAVARPLVRGVEAEVAVATATAVIAAVAGTRAHVRVRGPPGNARIGNTLYSACIKLGLSVPQQTFFFKCKHYCAEICLEMFSKGSGPVSRVAAATRVLAIHAADINRLSPS